MVKVRCNICGNEVSSFCNIKKVRVSVNKSRRCKGYVYDESKLKTTREIPTVRVGYRQQQENKRRFKAEMKVLKEELKKGRSQGTAKDLGLIQPTESTVITPGDPKFSVPGRDLKHPMTGDLSRFTTTTKNK